MIFIPVPFALGTLVGGLLLYYHVDGLIAFFAGLLTFLGILGWELAEYRKWIDAHTPGI